MEASDKRRTLDGHLAYWRTDRQTILKCCLLIREDAQGASATQREVQVQTQRSPDPHKMLDRALSILIHMPDNKREVKIIEMYAYGQIPHRPPRVVAQFWDRVPPAAVVDMAPLAAALLG